MALGVNEFVLFLDCVGTVVVEVLAVRKAVDLEVYTGEGSIFKLAEDFNQHQGVDS
jgi:hypothetical protein